MTQSEHADVLQPIHVLNLGAGVQSTALALMSHRGGFPGVPRFDLAIFADVGDEPDDVYRHLEWLIREVEPSYPVKVVKRGERGLGDSLIRGINSTGQRSASIPAFTAKSDGDTSSAGMTRRQCTMEFKVQPVEQAIRREVLGLKPGQRWPKDADVHQYFGLSFDESRRVARVKARMVEEGKCTPHFPLWDLKATRKDCVRWLASYGIPHEVPRSACVFCPYKSNEEWRHLRDTDPKGWARALQIDEAIRNHDSACAKKHNSRLYLHRSCLPLEKAPIDEPQSRETQYELSLVNECEGMCGL